VACSTRQRVVLEVRVVSGVHTSLYEIIGESGQWRGAHVSVWY
jgi:hypothetical protein